jgi:aminopeptidase N
VPRAFALVTVLLATMATPGAAPQGLPGPSPRNASYTLRAILDPQTQMIHGSGKLTWRNISHNPTSELQFHLYWNAWRDGKSSWMREQALGRGSLEGRPADDRSAMDVRTISIAGQNLLDRATFIAPDDGNPDDATVLRVPLPFAVQPEHAIEIELEWNARVPRTFARTGRLGNYYFIGQWFPKVGVLEDAGWNCHQFHAATEFFSDFGVYDVTLTVPTGWVVGATGTLQSATPAPGGTAHRFVQEDVHDFAWTTSPDFLDRHQQFNEPGLPPVDMRLLLQPEHAGQEDRHFAATRAALKYYGTWFGAYPYTHITIVDPATIFDAASQGQNTGGMEYPTLFTAGSRWYTPWVGSQPESVTVHEAGHQFWYGLVATNEFENAWMDEGFNTYSTARVLDTAFPGRFVAVGRYFGGLMSWSYDDVRWSRAIDGNRLDAYRPVATYDSQSTPTWRYWPGSASAITYNKTALWLATLERMLGWETTQKILATHFAQGAYRHPTPEQFFAIATDVSGRNLNWFFDAVYRSSATFDYGVADVQSTKRGNQFASTVVVRRYGDGVFPITTRVTYADGTTRDAQWDGRDRWQRIDLTHTSPIATVQVDPDRVLLLDLNYTNNSWTARPHGAEAAAKWAMRWISWAQELLLSYAFFA